MTIGKFDGLHRGHELLIERVARHQQDDGVDGVVIVFRMPITRDALAVSEKSLSANSTREKEPSAGANEDKISAFGAREEKSRLLTTRQMAERLEGRVSFLAEIPFDDTLSHMEPEAFITDVLRDIFRVKYLVVGEDFRFGHERRGDVRMLGKFAKTCGYGLEVIEKLKYRGRDISSTFIRQELGRGNLQLAEKLLGYPLKK